MEICLSSLQNTSIFNPGFPVTQPQSIKKEIENYNSMDPSFVHSNEFANTQILTISPFGNSTCKTAKEAC